MEIVSFRTPGLGDQTYLLTHDGQGVLVDPQRDIDRFLTAAAERDVQLRFVLETHLHNDYVSGARQAAQRAGAELVLPAAAGPAYPHTPAFHLEDIQGGHGLTLRPIHTPGHTPEHTSYLVLVDGEPVAVFSGGSLLVASAGRPDLLGPERARSLAKLQHGSLHRLAGLPRDVELLPTHGEGSFCTASGAGRYTSSIGAELDGNPFLAVGDAEAFADRLLAQPLPIPAFYRHMGPANTFGAPPMPPVDVPELTVDGLPAAAHVVDIRPRPALAAGHLPGALGIELRDDFGSWAGWLLPHAEPVVLVADRDQDVAEAVTQLARIGVDGVAGRVHDLGAHATARFELLGLDAFAERAAAADAQLLDVRMPAEHAAAAVAGAVHRFLPDLLAEGIPAELDQSHPVLVACGSGRRAAIAATVLLRAGYQPVVLDGVGVPELAATLSA
ncbi:rhodanese-like domain-containing protein [Catellatospora bangladeshensis]|uniref:MBL fold metallo-hydrolase n=1 Tax=Catellatospora bangladeshensis TaxID=310355 RepID=A0A8J3NLP9_9ACTN|nr:MBL fold metallo-hydrolase [Catellatospora bangladeshensis]GIF82775.1 MBL fold metallo-hydrolase [Catellatospora bangladeshensis]